MIKPTEALRACPACGAWPMALNAIETMRGWRAESYRCSHCKFAEDRDLMSPLRGSVPHPSNLAGKVPTTK